MDTFFITFDLTWKEILYVEENINETRNEILSLKIDNEIYHRQIERIRDNFLELLLKHLRVQESKHRNQS